MLLPQREKGNIESETWRLGLCMYGGEYSDILDDNDVQQIVWDRPLVSAYPMFVVNSELL